MRSMPFDVKSGTNVKFLRIHYLDNCLTRLLYILFD